MMKSLFTKLTTIAIPLVLIAACGGGGSSSSDNNSSRLNPDDIGNYIFVSSETYDGDLDELIGADLKCQNLAEDSRYAPIGAYKAWLSDYATDASSRLPHSDMPYVKNDASTKSIITIADDWTDLTDGTLQSAINYDEKGQQVTTTLDVWSNSDASGSKVITDPHDTCYGYSETYPSGAPSGKLDETDIKWTNSGSTLDCDDNARLYCFYTSYWYLDSDQDGYGNPSNEVLSDTIPGDNFIRKAGDCDDANSNVNPDATEIFNGYDDNCDGDIDHANYYVFATSLTYAADFGGLEAADQHCQNLADLSSDMPNGIYKAWLSDSTGSPSTRFTNPTLNYVRYDTSNGEEVVANSWADLTDGSLTLPIARDQNGNSVTGFVWSNTTTGGAHYAANSADACNNWTDTYTNFIVDSGDSEEAGSYWTTSNVKNCGESYRFYCFQQ